MNYKNLNISKKYIYSIATVAVVGVLFGAFFASRGGLPSGNETPAPVIESSGNNETFGSTFSNFIIGRSADGSAVKSNTPLVRATKFSTGEKVGLRIQTNSEVTVAFPIELRFLKKETGEETPALQSFRLKLTIKPGLKTYCCLSIPKEAGNYTLGILRNNSFIGTIGGIVVIPAKEQQDQSIFGL
jgi:hypothetical protein